MKRKKKEKDKPGAQSPALKNTSNILLCLEVSSGSSINEEITNHKMEIKMVVYFHRQGFTRLESFVYHDTVSDSGEVILYSKPFYIDNFLSEKGFFALIPLTWNECTNPDSQASPIGVLDKSVCFKSSENYENATVGIDHTEMDQVCLQSAAGAAAKSCTITDEEYRLLLSWYGDTTFSTQSGELWTTTNLKDIKRSVYQNLWSRISHFPEHYPCDHTRGLSLRCFTLKESIGMNRGASPPLDFVTRILNSKYWVLEADKWVDLLIICRWANPTTFTIKTKDVLCGICGNEWIEPGNTSCGHTFCTDCLHENFKQGCRQCPSCQTVVKAKVYQSHSAKVLLIRYREERHASEKIPSSEYIPVKAGKRKKEGDFCPHSIKKQCDYACGAASPSQNENSEPDFSTIYEALYPVRLKWYEIGLNLGIHYRELNVIKKENGDFSTCLRETLIIRFETETPKWNDFIKALENETVGHKEVAKKLKEHA